MLREIEEMDYREIAAVTNLPIGTVMSRLARSRQMLIGQFNADAETAALLAVPSATACLLLERKTWRGDQHVTHVRQIFPGESYDLIARFTPRGGD